VVVLLSSEASWSAETPKSEADAAHKADRLAVVGGRWDAGVRQHLVEALALTVVLEGLGHEP
jgi:hypothetical protein